MQPSETLLPGLMAAAQSGDTIRISAGDYRGSAAVAQWTAGNLTICGVGGRARLFADGRYRGYGVAEFTPGQLTTTLRAPAGTFTST